MPELTMPPVAEPTTFGAARAEVKDFAARHGLREALDAALRLVDQTFPAGSVPDLRLQFSPDHESDRLVVNVTTPADVRTAVACHQNLSDRWTRELPPRAQERLVSTFSTG